MNKKFTVNSYMLLRVGQRETILNQYKNKYITFSCAANWIGWAHQQLTEKNPLNGTTDLFDCSIACYSHDDKNIKIDENYYKNNLVIFKGNENNYYYFNPVITMPAICFYSINRSLFNQYNFCKGKELIFPLKQYAACFDYNDPAYLLITSVNDFFEDLKKAIPKSIKDNIENLTSKGFSNLFDSDHPYVARDIKYIKDLSKQKYDNSCDYFEAIFRKDFSYKWQNEMRIVIPNISFKTSFCKEYQSNKYYDINSLNVYLPNLHSYAFIIDNSYELLWYEDTQGRIHDVVRKKYGE